MRLFSSESYYNAQLGQWDERYWIDGRVTDADTYFYEQEIEKEIENKKLQNQEFENNPCDTCPCRDCCEDEDGFDYEDLLDVFVNKILATEGCPGCIADILDEFANIFIPDEDECEGYDCEECCEELVGCVEPVVNIYITTGDINVSSDFSDFDINKIVEQLKRFGLN